MLGALWPAVCDCFWGGGVAPSAQTAADLSGSNERLESARPGGTLGNMDTGNSFCSSKMIACYPAVRGRKMVLFGCLSYYLVYVISF